MKEVIKVIFNITYHYYPQETEEETEKHKESVREEMVIFPL
jgi:hypothetical protein